jgi:hypothetical protein
MWLRVLLSNGVVQAALKGVGGAMAAGMGYRLGTDLYGYLKKKVHKESAENPDSAPPPRPIRSKL